MRSFVGGLFVGILTMSSAAQAEAASITVTAAANIFAANSTMTPGADAICCSPGGEQSGTGVYPPFISFAAGLGQTITFSSVTGFTGCCGGPSASPADGAGGPTDVGALRDISGIVGPTQMFLVGLFVEPAGCRLTPQRLDFTGNTDFASLSPEPCQTFWIGDGLTGYGSGRAQVFHVPSTATHFFLGFADSSVPGGRPGSYGDNTGSLTATFALNAPATVHAPEPSTWLIVSLGMVLIAGRRFRRTARS